MIYDLRTYTIVPGRVSEYLDWHQRDALPRLRRILGEPVAYWTTDTGVLNQVVHLWKYASLADLEARFAALANDPEWHEYRAQVGKTGLVLNQERQIMRPTPFSPMQ